MSTGAATLERCGARIYRVAGIAVKSQRTVGRNRYPFLVPGAVASLRSQRRVWTVTVDCFVARRAPRNDIAVIASEAKQSG